MVSVRISAELERRLDAYAKQAGVSRSEVIKKSISEYLDRHMKSNSAYELGKDLFGQASSGDGNLSKNRKEIVEKAVKQKHAKRSNH